MTLAVRDATIDDAPAITAIYNDGIASRQATFDTEPCSVEEIAADLRADMATHPAVVVLDGERVAGFAWSSAYRQRACYAGIAEFSVYVARDARRRGVGRRALAALIERCEARGFWKIMSRIFTDNMPSRALCAGLGFREVGVYRRHGKLDGAWKDCVIVERLLGDAARNVEGLVKPSVLFVCRHNTGRSQMAEAYLRHFAGDRVDVTSAGTIGADVPDPGVVAVMAEDGIDIAAARPKLLDPDAAQRADRVITMGCDVEGVPRVDDDWQLPDPKGQPRERVREIRDLVKEKVRTLARSLLDA